MASLQAHLISLVLKATFKRQLAGERDIVRLRAIFKPVPFKTPRGVTIRPHQLGGVPGEWISTDASQKTLLFLHGGGYVACAPLNHRPITCFFAQKGFRVFAPDYRLAPEHPFPAALDDVLSVYTDLLEQAGESFPVAGDSAGGGLAMALILSARATTKRLPSAAALFSPWTDLAATGTSIQTNGRKDAMFRGSDIDSFAQMYLQGGDPKNHLASPLYGDLAGLPPLLIHVGANEALLDDSVRLAERAQAAGSRVDLKIWPVVPHAWQLGAGRIPEADQSLTEAAEFLKNQLPHTRATMRPVLRVP